jgi:hypothetical protein
MTREEARARAMFLAQRNGVPFDERQFEEREQRRWLLNHRPSQPKEGKMTPSVSSREARERMLARIRGEAQPKPETREDSTDQEARIETTVARFYASRHSPSPSRPAAHQSKSVYRQDAIPDGSSAAARLRMLDRIRERSASCDA